MRFNLNRMKPGFLFLLPAALVSAYISYATSGFHIAGISRSTVFDSIGMAITIVGLILMFVPRSEHFLARRNRVIEIRPFVTKIVGYLQTNPIPIWPCIYVFCTVTLCVAGLQHKHYPDSGNLITRYKSIQNYQFSPDIPEAPFSVISWHYRNI